MRGLRLRQRGDTILEVMICVAVVGLLLASAFALANRNTVSELKAQERSIGVKVAETQLELLKSYADRHKLPDKNTFFCMTPSSDPANSTGVNLVVWDGVSPNANRETDIETDYPDECDQQELAFNYEFVIWSPNRSAQVGGLGNIPYAVTVRWDAADGGERQEVKMFYNIYDTDNPDFDNGDDDPPAQCSDGINNDSDALVDYPADQGCTSPDDNDETNPQCNDGINNDGDTTIDYPADRGCSNLQDNSESPDPPLPMNVVINGSSYSNCVEAEGLWNDGSDRCFRTGTSMFAWREVRVTYPTPGLTAGAATMEINYQEYNLPAPAGYTHYDFDITFAGTTRNYRLPVAAPGVQQTYSIAVTVPASVPTNMVLEWKNNIGNDPDIQINSIRIRR